jgi:threonine dehydrogenase-like Zn-dependent dehydrogenase
VFLQWRVPLPGAEAFTKHAQVDPRVDLAALEARGTTELTFLQLTSFIIECTGASRVIADVITRSARSGVVCMTGVSSGGHTISLDLGSVNRSMVLENHVVFGSVNANRAHYEAGSVALARADRAWLPGLITRRVPTRRVA